MGTDVAAMRRDLKLPRGQTGTSTAGSRSASSPAGSPLRAPTAHTWPPGVQGQGRGRQLSALLWLRVPLPRKKVPRGGSPGFLGTVSQTESGA